MWIRFMLAAGLWLFFSKFTLAALVNVTIDDTFGDPKTGAQVTYSPGGWKNGTNCSGCAAHPDVSQVYLATWHDGTWYPPNNTTLPMAQSASVPFNGSAVYIYCIIAHSSILPDGNTDMTFFIDGESVGHYILPPSAAQPSYSYGVNVYSNSSVPPGQHTIKIQNGLLGQKALILLDYITYSYDDGISASKPPLNTSSGRKSRTAVIAGIIIGALGFLLLLGFVFLACRRRRQFLQDPRNGFAIDVFPAPASRSGSWVTRPDSASGPLTQIPAHPSASSPSRKVGPGITRIMQATPSQEGILPSQSHVHNGFYAAMGANHPSASSSNPSQNDVGVGPTRDNAEWNLLLTPRQVQQRDRKHPEENVSPDFPPVYSDAG